jgi:hypothetical protein
VINVNYFSPQQQLEFPVFCFLAAWHEILSASAKVSLVGLGTVHKNTLDGAPISAALFSLSAAQCLKS